MTLWQQITIKLLLNIVTSEIIVVHLNDKQNYTLINSLCFSFVFLLS